MFYYGVLADITPPVALAAYAAAGMAGADPFRTGNTAFRLGLGKVLVPFVFVFSPSLLLVAKGFTWPDFWLAFLGCVAGITCLSAGITGWMLTRTALWERVLLIVAAILLVAPELYSSLLGAALVVPVLLRQWAACGRRLSRTGEAESRRQRDRVRERARAEPASWRDRA